MDEYARLIATDLPEALPMQTICASKGLQTPNAAAIVIIVVLTLLSSFAIIGGFLEYLDIRRRKKNLQKSENLGEDVKPVNTKRPHIIKRLLLAFSPITNFQKLAAPTSVPHLASLNGLRIMSLLWVILGHTIYWATFSAGFDNSLYVMTKVLPTFWTSIVVNAPFSVDSFFYMSGFLVAYLAVQEYAKKGKFNWLLYYFHRIYRLTPPYLLSLFIFWKLTPYLGEGPWWEHVKYYVSLTRCNSFWWTNVLYINNFYPTIYDEQCMGWSWYLANDWQMYAITPIFLIVYWKNKRWGILLINLGIITSLSVNAGLVYYNHFTPYIPLMADGRYNSLVYEKPYARIHAYLVGMLGGFLLNHLETKDRRRLRMSWITWILTYIVSGVLMFTAVFGTYGLYQSGGGWNDAQKLLYLTFSRFGWSVGVAMMMHTFYVKHGWILRTFLEWRVWSVLARLSFSSYLYHPVIMTVVYYSSRQMFYYSPWSITMNFFSFTILSFLIGMVSFLLVERPLMNLEKFMLG